MIGAQCGLRTENSKPFPCQVIVILLQTRGAEVGAPKGSLRNLSEPQPSTYQQYPPCADLAMTRLGQHELGSALPFTGAGTGEGREGRGQSPPRPPSWCRNRFRSPQFTERTLVWKPGSPRQAVPTYSRSTPCPRNVPDYEMSDLVFQCHKCLVYGASGMTSARTRNALHGKFCGFLRAPSFEHALAGRILLASRRMAFQV